MACMLRGQHTTLEIQVDALVEPVVILRDASILRCLEHAGEWIENFIEINGVDAEATFYMGVCVDGTAY